MGKRRDYSASRCQTHCNCSPTRSSSDAPPGASLAPILKTAGRRFGFRGDRHLLDPPTRHGQRQTAGGGEEARIGLSSRAQAGMALGDVNQPVQMTVRLLLAMASPRVPLPPDGPAETRRGPKETGARRPPRIGAVWLAGVI